jgi:hypothetical protein
LIKRVILLVLLILTIVISYTVCVEVSNTLLEISSEIEGLKISVEELSLEVNNLKSKGTEIFLFRKSIRHDYIYSWYNHVLL